MLLSWGGFAANARVLSFIKTRAPAFRAEMKFQTRLETAALDICKPESASFTHLMQVLFQRLYNLRCKQNIITRRHESDCHKSILLSFAKY